jgi:mitochondrial import receptor subunit TOM40
MASPVNNLGDLSKLSIPEFSQSSSGSSSVWKTNPLLSYINDVYSSVASRRAALNLTNPGTIENLNKEVSKDVFLNNYFFTGLRADLTKSFSMNPAFQVSHSFSMGSGAMPPYGFAAFYATDNVFMQGNIDNDFSLSGRFHYGWDKFNTSKANLQLANGQPSMVQLEHDFQGSDFSLNLKSLNPSFLEGGFTGVAVGSYLQSITSKLALGLEAVYSSQSTAYPPDAAISYVGRYVSNDWIASAQVQAQGAVLASFWRKVTDKVEAGVETQVSMSGQQQAVMMGAAPTIEATTTIGAKYEFRQSVFRGQIDSTGKVSCLLERRVLPVVSVIFAGEIDHSKKASRLGLGLQFEAGGEEALQQDPGAQPHPPM